MWGAAKKNRLKVWRVGDQPDPPMEGTQEVARRLPRVLYDCLCASTQSKRTDALTVLEDTRRMSARTA